MGGEGDSQRQATTWQKRRFGSAFGAKFGIFKIARRRIIDQQRA
jgi:hypothetical protein